MTEQNKQDNLGPTPWGSEPIRGLNYDYLDIVEPPTTEPEPVMPETTSEFNALQAEDFYKRVRGKIVAWAQGAGAGKEVTGYILLLPDIMALIVRLMGDPRVSAHLKAEIAAASAYIIIPIDLMPEAVLGPVGLIDDAIVGVIALNRVIKVMGATGEDILREHWAGDDDILEVIRDLLGKADQFVTGRVWNGIKKFMKDVSTPASSKPSGPIIEGSARPIDPSELDR